jgi:hypothetical protein
MYHWICWCIIYLFIIIITVIKQCIITYSKGCCGRFSWSFPSIHPSVLSSIHGWHHTGKKTLAEINNLPPPLHMWCYVGKACPAPGGAPQDFDINISNKPNIYLPIFSHGRLYVAISRVTSNANIKIFNGQDPNAYMRNVVYREVLKM